MKTILLTVGFTQVVLLILKHVHGLDVSPAVIWSPSIGLVCAFIGAWTLIGVLFTASYTRRLVQRWTRKLAMHN